MRHWNVRAHYSREGHQKHLCLFPAQGIMLLILCWTVWWHFRPVCSLYLCMSAAGVCLFKMRTVLVSREVSRCSSRPFFHVYLRLNIFLNENGTEKKQQNVSLICVFVSKGFSLVCFPVSVCHWTWERSLDKKELKLIYYLYISGILLPSMWNAV